MEKTRTVVETYHLDDITGQQAKTLQTYDVLVGNVAGALELSAHSFAALTALIQGDDAKWRKLLNGEPVEEPKPKSHGQAPRVTDARYQGEWNDARKWAKENGYEVKEHGNPGKTVILAFREAGFRAKAAA